MFEKTIKKNLLKSLEQIKYGEIYLTTPEGDTFHHKR